MSNNDGYTNYMNIEEKNMYERMTESEIVSETDAKNLYYCTCKTV